MSFVVSCTFYRANKIIADKNNIEGNKNKKKINHVHNL